MYVEDEAERLPSLVLISAIYFAFGGKKTNKRGATTPVASTDVLSEGLYSLRS